MLMPEKLLSLESPFFSWLMVIVLGMVRMARFCEIMNIIVVRLPANTTHILQTYDQFIYREFQQNGQKHGDEFLFMRRLSGANKAYKKKLAVPGYQSLTAEDAR